MRSGISTRGCVRPSVGPSVGLSHRSSISEKWAKFKKKTSEHETVSFWWWLKKEYSSRLAERIWCLNSVRLVFLGNWFPRVSFPGLFRLMPLSSFSLLWTVIERGSSANEWGQVRKERERKRNNERKRKKKTKRKWNHHQARCKFPLTHNFPLFTNFTSPSLA